MPATYHTTVLPGGLTVATAEMPHMTSVCLGLWVAVGSRCEPADLNGASHFIEHMMFKGTRRRDAAAISAAVEGAGGYLNAFTTEEFTCLHARAAHDRFPGLLDVLTDMFLHSRFDPREFRKEREVIREEVAMYRDEPPQHVQDLLNATLWPGHPLGRPLTGTPRSLNGLTRAGVLEFLRTRYRRGGVLLVAAGRCRHEAVTRAVARLAGRFPAGPRAGFTPYTARQAAPRVRLCRRDTSQLQLAVGIRTGSRHDPRRHALRLLNVILGENMSSRLFQSLREEHGLAYSVHSSLVLFEDVGALTLAAGLDPGQLHRALRLVRREFQRLLREPPPVAELARARDYLIGQLDLSLEGTENQMNWVGESLLCHGRILPPEEIRRRVASVRPLDVREAARACLRPDRLSLAVVSPLRRAAGLTGALCP
jgi:predicted Zn-dependent peptidase